MPASAALREAALRDALQAKSAFGTLPAPGSRLVVAVGSNAAPDVLCRKLAHVPTETICLQPVHVANITVGHSAHVAARGYLPAAPVFAGQGGISTTAAWLAPAHFKALDATEPNYHRRTVNTRDHPLIHGGPTSLIPDDASLPAEFDLYVSRHGVLADPATGDPLPLGSQTDAFAWLSRQLDDATLTESASRVCARMAADPAAMTARIRAAGLSRPCGFPTSLPIGHGR